MEVKFSKDGKQLTITLDVKETREVSDSGKTRGVASSHGNKPTGVKDPETGREVIVGVNAYVYAKDKADKGKESKKKSKKSDDSEEEDD